jgi:hypothetical protein
MAESLIHLRLDVEYCGKVPFANFERQASFQWSQQQIMRRIAFLPTIFDPIEQIQAGKIVVA